MPAALAAFDPITELVALTPLTVVVKVLPARLCVKELIKFVVALAMPLIIILKRFAEELATAVVMIEEVALTPLVIEVRMFALLESV